jgi:DNA polymerase elongation subunit (family B)
MRFYTNFYTRGDTVFIRGYDNGRRIVDRIEYSPTFYMPSRKNNTTFQTVHGEPVEPVELGSIREARDFIKRYEDVDNFKIYGSTLFEYTCLNENYGKDFDTDAVKIASLDIEVGSEDGFPEPDLANQPVIAITVGVRGKYFVFGVGDYQVSQDNVKYVDCKGERRLLDVFLEFWKKIDPDIVTGWNVGGFDIAYLHNRISKIISPKDAKRLSPANQIRERQYKQHNKTITEYEPVGLEVLDYLELYKKFTYSQQESYRLDHIAFVELGERKLDYSEVENLHQLYKTDYQKFIDYNIRDVELVDKLEDKMRLIEQALTIAYDAKVNYSDVFTQVRMWDVLIHNYLLEQNIVIPPKENRDKSAQYAGAYVKDPQVGMHEWVMSFDLNSLYPHLIMQYNISPDTFVEGEYQDVSLEKIIDGEINAPEEMCLTANGHYYRKDFQGFLPEMMELMYNERVLYKQKMIEAQKELEEVNRQLKELT